MDTTTITATITYPTADIEAFADANGYFETVLEIDGTTSPNPESRIEYVKRLFLERSLDWFAKDIIKQIERQSDIDKAAAIKASKDTIAQAITIT